MNLLEHPDAQALLADAELSAAAVCTCQGRLEAFAARYLPHFYRAEQRGHALTVLRGKLKGLERKTIEPIARAAGQHRRPLQLFVGAGGWQDRPVLEELWRHVTEAIGDPEGVFILDGSGFPKKGTDSCGVARQWCGRLGKVDNCQVGYFVGYASRHGQALLSSRLYLTQDWAADTQRRAQTYVSPAVTFQEGWRLALGLLDEVGATVPGGWVVGDDEFGRCSALRAQLRWRKRRYVLDVPSTTSVRDPAERRPPRRPGSRPRLPVFERVDSWVARQPAGRWRTVRLRDGAKGPVRVRVLLATVQTKDEDGCVGPSERLVVVRTLEERPQTWYALSNARQAQRAELAHVQGTRHRIEEVLEQGKGEVGLAHYEVRSWVGWHHHMTLSLLALWFLQLERLRLGKKNTGHHGSPGAAGVHGVAAGTESERRTDCRSRQPGIAA